MRYIGLVVGKIVNVVLKLLGRHGGSFPGQVALVFCKDILRYFKYPAITVLVTGTNGKTSTSNIISGVFKEAGYHVVSNSRGDNIIFGIASLLIKNASIGFKVKADVLVIEVDELTLAKQLNNIDASDIVVTNFFRDQLDRAGEMETIIDKIADALSTYNNNLYLNEDDPNVKRLSYAAKNANVLSFGLERLSGASETNSEAKEGKFCFNCHSELEYDYYQYSHIGRYHCLGCDFKSDVPDYLLKNIDYKSLDFEVVSPRGDVYKLRSNINANYHLYNLAAASAVSLNYNILERAIYQVFYHFNLGIGRMENIKIGEENVLLNLVKNPTGFNEIVKYINNNESKKALIFVLNDNDQDGTDTSWIWDAEFEKIFGLEHVIVSGKRAYEAALRFKIGGIDAHIDIEKDVDKALDMLLTKEGEKHVVSTYTALFSTRNKMLSKSGR